MIMFSEFLRKSHVVFRIVAWHLLRRFCHSITVSTRQGVLTVSLQANDPISRILFTHGGFELDFVSKAVAFLRTIKKIPPKGQGTLIDIGANIGLPCIGLLLSNEMEKAVAIEPDPSNFTLLQHNVAQNRMNDRLICLPYAASDQKGQLEFELSVNNFGDHRVRRRLAEGGAKELFSESKRRVIQVQADTLDNILSDLPGKFREDIALVWIDVQGYEGYVFQGAHKALSKGVPTVAEIWPYGMQRCGMSPRQFCSVVERIWPFYWIMRRGKFIRYPVETLSSVFEELGDEGLFDNIIFTD